MFCVLTAYFDDGGTHEGSTVAVLAGYLGYKEDWDAFEADWKAFLRREGVDEQEGYHAVECAHAKPHTQFEGWPSERINAVHKAAVETITRHPVLALGRGVYFPNFLAMYAEKAAAAGLFPMPKPEAYSCYDWLLRMVGIIASTRKPPEVADILIDRLHGAEGRLVDFHNAAMADRYAHLSQYIGGPPLFRSSHDYVQLQAADVLAYEMALESARKYDPANTYPPRRSWTALVDHATRLSSQRQPLLRIDLEWEGHDPPHPLT